MYLLVTLIRNFLFNHGLIPHEHHDGIFVLCIGNIRAGGTGKTPMVEYMIKHLSAMFPLAVVSLGYKRKTKGLKEVLLTDSARAVGDEPKQMKEKFPSVPFFVNKDRNVAVKYIRRHLPDTKLIILDDAYQYRKIQADKTLLLTEYARPYFKDYVIPYGRLRERRKESRRADYIVVTKCPNSLSEEDKTLFANKLNIRSYQKVFFSKIKYLPLLHYCKQSETINCRFIENNAAKQTLNNPIIVTGIDNPSMIKTYVENNLLSETDKVTVIKFADHHSYTPKDITHIRSVNPTGAIITTDKDAVKLKEIIDDFYVLRIENEIENGLLADLENDIISVIQQSENNI